MLFWWCFWFEDTWASTQPHCVSQWLDGYSRWVSGLVLLFWKFTFRGWQIHFSSNRFPKGVKQWFKTENRVHCNVKNLKRKGLLPPQSWYLCFLSNLNWRGQWRSIRHIGNRSWRCSSDTYVIRRGILGKDLTQQLVAIDQRTITLQSTKWALQKQQLDSDHL